MVYLDLYVKITINLCYLTFENLPPLKILPMGIVHPCV